MINQGKANGDYAWAGTVVGRKGIGTDPLVTLPVSGRFIGHVVWLANGGAYMWNGTQWLGGSGGGGSVRKDWIVAVGTAPEVSDFVTVDLALSNPVTSFTVPELIGATIRNLYVGNQWLAPQKDDGYEWDSTTGTCTFAQAITVYDANIFFESVQTGTTPGSSVSVSNGFSNGYF